MNGNGDNRFYIVIKCPYAVYDEEWAEMLFGLNWWLQKHKDGKFQNVGAFLEEIQPTNRGCRGGSDGKTYS